MELRQQCAVLVVGVVAVHEDEHRRVLQLSCPGVADGPPVRGGRRQAGVGQVVAVPEAGHDESGVDGRHHIGEFEGVAAVRDDGLGHRPRLDGVPQLDHREPGRPVGGQPLQLRHQVLAQRAAGAVVDEQGLSARQFARRVADEAPHGCLGGRGQIVVERDAAGDGAQQSFHHLSARVGVEPADDEDGQPAGPDDRA